MASHFRDTNEYGPFEPSEDVARGPRGKRHSDRQRRRIWPKVAIIVLAVLVLVACVEGFFLYNSAKTVREESRIAMGAANECLAAAKAGDRDKLVSSARKVSDSSHRLRQDLAGVEWTIASFVPIVGSDVNSVRTLADVFVDVADEGLVPLSEETEIVSLSELARDGAVNMDALKSLCSVAQKMRPLIDRSAASIESLPKAHIQQVASVVETARGALTVANVSIGQSVPLLGDLPTLLGDNGVERNYLILASNTAEVHASGGFVGSMGILSAKDGALTLGDFETVYKLLPVNEVSAGATAEEISIFGDRVDISHGDHNVTPDFSRVGQLYYNIWDIAQQQQLDGVISVDPVFLQSMLALTGGIETSYGVTVDGTNAAQMVLNQCLFWGGNNVTDDFYKEVASGAFRQVLSNLGHVDTMELVQTVGKASEEGRFLVWLQDADIEKRLQQAGFGWELPHDRTRPLAGVYINDSSVSKSSYYLSLDTEVGDPIKNADGSQTYHAVARMRHNMDSSLVTDLPEYLKTEFSRVTQDSRSEAELSEVINLVAPEGGSIQNISAKYEDSATPVSDPSWTEHAYQGLQLLKASVRIMPGESYVVSFDIVTSPEASESLQVRTTPVVPHAVRGD